MKRNRPLAASIAAALLLAIGGLAWVSVVQSNAREAMSATNTDLAASTRIALENEQLAKSNAARATAEEQLATKVDKDQMKRLKARIGTMFPISELIRDLLTQYLDKKDHDHR